MNYNDALKNADYDDVLTQYICDNAPEGFDASYEHPGYIDVRHASYPDVYAAATPGWDGEILPIQCHAVSDCDLVDSASESVPWTGNLEADAARYFLRVQAALAAAQGTV